MNTTLLTILFWSFPSIGLYFIWYAFRRRQRFKRLDAEWAERMAQMRANQARDDDHLLDPDHPLSPRNPFNPTNMAAAAALDDKAMSDVEGVQYTGPTPY
jgi:hypothetical protein